MALKLGELVAYLKADNSQFDKGLDKAERDFRDTGRDLTEQARKTGAAIGDGLWTGADGRLRDARGRFSAAGAGAGAASALGFLGRFGSKFGGMLPDVVGGVFSGMPPQVQAAVAAAATALAITMSAVIGAALAAGILLALGGGVLALGISQAIKDPAVAKAWKGFGDRAKKALSGFVEPFKGPLKRAADTFGDAIERMGPTLKEIGTTMAPIIDKLAPALADFAEQAMPGLKDALEKSKPLFDTLAKHLPDIGNAVSIFFVSVAGGSEGANTFLDHFLNVLEGSIIFAGVLIGWLASLYQWIVDTFSKLGDITGKVWDSIKGGASSAWKWVRDKFSAIVDSVKGLGGRISRAAGGMWDGIKNSFKSAVNWIIRKWNGLSFSLPGLSIPGLGQVFGGATLSTPNIPLLAKGGTALTAGAAIVGERGPELLHMPRGATVQPLPPGGGGLVELLVHGEFRVRGSDLVLVLRDRVAVGGGNVQRVIGTSD